MARKALVTFDFPSAPTVGGATTWYVTPTGTNASGTWGISVTGNAGTATTLQTARSINLVSFNGSANVTIPRITCIDDRAIAPTDGSAGYITGFFTSWANNSTSPYADALLFRSYTDGTAGNENLLMLRRDAIGMRIWQQTYNSGTAFSSFKDVAWTDGTNATGTWTVSTSGNAGTATTLQTARTLTIGSTGKTFDGSANVSWTLGEIGAQGALTLTTTGTSGVATLVGNTLNIPNYATGSGTVTSVGLSMPAMFTVTNSPVTTSGTLTATLASQTANTVFVAPNGTAGAPTFRSLVEADIPTLSQAKITNLTTDLSAKANLASPTFTGTPSLPTGTIGVTQTAGNSTTALATTAFVTTADNLKANLASPTFTGTPLAPTATQGTNTTQIATTAFVQAEIVADAVLLTTNQTVAGDKTFSGTTALASTSTIGGAVIGYRDVPVTISNANTTFALADAGKAFGKDNTTAYTYTIPANGTVAFPIGTVITVFNNNATSNITIAITTDTLRLAGTTTTGSRTVAPFALCTLFKVSSTVWMASGAGVT